MMCHRVNVLPRNWQCGCYCGGVVNWRTRLVHWAAKIAGLHVRLEGFPLGTNRNLLTVQGAAFESQEQT